MNSDLFYIIYMLG